MFPSLCALPSGPGRRRIAKAEPRSLAEDYWVGVTNSGRGGWSRHRLGCAASDEPATKLLCRGEFDLVGTGVKGWNFDNTLRRGNSPIHTTSATPMAGKHIRSQVPPAGDSPLLTYWRDAADRSLPRPLLYAPGASTTIMLPQPLHGALPFQLGLFCCRWAVGLLCLPAVALRGHSLR